MVLRVRTISVGVSILILVQLVLFGCGSNSGDSKSKKAENVGALRSSSISVKNSLTHNDGPVIIFGDSIAEGFGATSEAQSLVGCLERFTDKEVVLLAESGSTSKSMVTKVVEAQNLNPSLVIVSLGGNDVLEHNYYRNFPPLQTYSYMENILYRLISFNSLVLYLGLNPPKSMTQSLGIDASRLKRVGDIAVLEGAILIPDGFEGLWGKSEFMADQLHPNDLGYKKICQKIQDALAPHYLYIK